MSDLDDKLQEIIDECAESYYPLNEYPNQPIYTDQNKVTLDRTVAQIHQAFKEAGYYKFTGTQEQQAAIANMMLGNEVMTGQEWYLRFEKELAKELSTGNSGIVQTEDTPILEAAKRAAGIEA